MKTTHIAPPALLCALVLALAAPTASRAATWKTKAAGNNYLWTDSANWLDGTLPSATTPALFNDSNYRPAGNQTIGGDGEAAYIDLHNNTYTTTRTFTGNLNLGYFDARIGTVALTGSWTVTGTPTRAYCRVGTATGRQSGMLDIKGGGSLSVEGPVGVHVGRNNDDNKDTAGRIILREGGRLSISPTDGNVSTAGLTLGRTSDTSKATFIASSYVQEGGEARIGRLIAAYETNAVGSVVVLGGTFDLAFNKSTDSRYRIGHRGYGHFQLLGGNVYALTNATPGMDGTAAYNLRQYTFEIGSGLSKTAGSRGAYFYANAGTLWNGADLSIGGQSNHQAAPDIHATIDGTAYVTSRTVRVGANSGSGRTSLNLNGGTLVTDFLFSNPDHQGVDEVNANGGKIVFPASSRNEQGLFLDAINIYEGGLEIQCADHAISLGNAGTNVVLKTPTGYGIESIQISNNGASTIVNCANPPWIELSGGSGTGASAIGLVNWQNNADTLTNIVITCRGQGYAAGESPTATIIRMDVANDKRLSDRTVLTLTENKPGALIKTGSQNLNIFAQPEFAGTYEVRQGWMIQSTTAGIGSPHVSAIIVGGDNAHFQAGSGNATAVEANWNPVNPGATLTLGTTYGPGQLVIPRAAATETEPFRQTFTSLSVNGTGNAITFNANGNSQKGAVVSFGTITCAQDSQLTIPHPKTGAVKVYCTGMPAGTSLKNIVFENLPGRTATVGDDGQLVPLPLAFVVVIR